MKSMTIYLNKYHHLLKLFKLILISVFLSWFIITSIEANNELIQKDLVLWNTLDSKTEVENSQVGPGGLLGEGHFETGRFGTAYSIDYGLSSSIFPELFTIAFPKEVIHTDSGTIEIWAKLEQFPPLIGAGGSIEPFPYLIHINDGYSRFDMGLNRNDGAGNGGLCGFVGHGFTTGSGVFGHWSYKQVLGEQVQGWHHYALVWDKNGIAGLPDGTQKLAVFLDGQLESGRWHDYYAGASEIVPLVDGELRLAVNYWVPEGKIIVDNLVIWNRAITDFSHRFKENPLLVELTHFTTHSTQKGISIIWTTEIELDHAGYYLWRALDNDDKEITTSVEQLSQLIPAKGQERKGTVYSYLDSNIQEENTTFYYLLEDVDTKGKRTFHCSRITAIVKGQGPTVDLRSAQVFCESVCEDSDSVILCK
jgi:hypothetical protein